MNTLLKKTLLRAGLVIIYGGLGALLFMKVEQKSVTNVAAAEGLLQSLRTDIQATNTNWSEQQFHNFAKRAFEAIRLGEKLDWTFINSCSFIISTLTTVGKLE